MRARDHRMRGQAITEFALVVPLLIVIIFFSLYFTELVRAKLKLQEASRFAAWELTSYALDDYGKGDHANAFSIAQKATIDAELDKYKDLESIDDRTPGGFIVGYSNVTATIKNLDPEPFVSPVPGINGNAFVNGLTGALGNTVSAAHGLLGFNTKGKIEVETKMSLDNRILPRHFLDEGGTGFFKADVWGGRNLQNLTLKNRFTLIASGWQLPDGADAEQHQTGGGGPRAGVHRGGSGSGLYEQVKRMRLFGAPNKLMSIPGLSQVFSLIGSFVPDPLTAAYVVSHNYFAAGDKGVKDRGCDQDPSHGAQWGMNNLQDESGKSDGPGLDWDRRKCYDTAPFRDTPKYGDSLYRQMFEARGSFFMGCKVAQADNPSEAGPPQYSNKDKHNKKYNCEGP